MTKPLSIKEQETHPLDTQQDMFKSEMDKLLNEVKTDHSLSDKTFPQKVTNIISKNKKDGDVKLKASDLLEKAIEGAFISAEKRKGSSSSIARKLTGELLAINHDSEGSVSELIQILSTMFNIEPKDHIEAMLATQMIAVHNTLMRNCRYSETFFQSESKEGINLGVNSINSITKLAKTYMSQMDTLNRYRGKGHQKITVEHLNVNDGGKAVVGNIATLGEENKGKN